MIISLIDHKPYEARYHNHDSWRGFVGTYGIRERNLAGEDFFTILSVPEFKIAVNHIH